MNIGDRVRKTGGSYQHSGTVVSVFKTVAGEDRIVLEFDAPVSGMLHIYRADQVEPHSDPSGKIDTSVRAIVHPNCSAGHTWTSYYAWPSLGTVCEVCGVSKNPPEARDGQ